MKNLLFLSFSLILLGAGCARTFTPPQSAQPPQVPPPAPAAPLAAPLGSNGLIMESQDAGASVVIANVVTAKQGYIVVHADTEGKPGKILGASPLLNAGETRDVTVQVKTKPGTLYWVMLHADNGNKTFSAAEDLPVKDETGALVMKRVQIRGAEAPKPLSTAVSIKNFAFAPKAVTVKRGTKVTFTNFDSAPHTATADRETFDSKALSRDSTFTLDTSQLSPGTYAYSCTFHPSMRATLVVEE